MQMRSIIVLCAQSMGSKMTGTKKRGCSQGMVLFEGLDDLW